MKLSAFRAGVAGVATVGLAALGTLAGPAPAEAVPAMPQGYPIQGLHKPCDESQATQEGLPEWRFGETARRYLNDGTAQFTNRTDQPVPYTATVETGTNHKISANSKAELPNGWNTTAKSDIGLKESNGWTDSETFGPITLQPGESFRVEYGVLEKDFISMFVECKDGLLQNQEGANVVRGTGPAERYAFAYIIKADGTLSDVALDIPARAQGANSKPTGDTYTAVSGPSLEKVADPQKDEIVAPDDTFARDPEWPNEGDECRPGDKKWYPLDIEAVTPTFRKPGYSVDFRNWSEGDYEWAPVTDNVVGAEYNGYANWVERQGKPPQGWLQSVGATERAYMPVGTKLKHLQLAPGERVRVEYGTTMSRINYRELHCGKDKKYSMTSNYKQASAPSGFWAEATIQSPDGSSRTEDVTPDDYRDLPVPTQASH